MELKLGIDNGGYPRSYIMSRSSCSDRILSANIFRVKMAWIMSTFQGPRLLFTKFSILLLFKRVFTTRKRPFQIALVVVGTYSVLVGVGSFIEFAVQCVLVPCFWERAYTIIQTNPPNPLSGWCMPQKLHISIPLFANLVSVLVLLGLPAIELWGFQMRRIKKIGSIPNTFSWIVRVSWNAFAFIMPSRLKIVAMRLGTMLWSYYAALAWSVPAFLQWRHSWSERNGNAAANRTIHGMSNIQCSLAPRGFTKSSRRT